MGDTAHASVTVPTSDSQETTAISTSDQDTTTTTSVSQETTTSLADDQESSVTDVISNSETEATTEAVDQSFLCTATDGSVDASGDLPMSCKHMDGDEEKTIMLLIPKDVLGDVSLTRLFDKNVKIVVKDFMIMDRSPRRLL